MKFSVSVLFRQTETGEISSHQHLESLIGKITHDSTLTLYGQSCNLELILIGDCFVGYLMPSSDKEADRQTGDELSLNDVLNVCSYFVENNAPHPDFTWNVVEDKDEDEGRLGFTRIN